MGGERRQAHLDRLAVADVREHLVEDRQRRGVGRRPQPRLMEERREPDRLQRNGLAAGVRAADHERADAAELEVDRDRRRRAEQRMTGADEPHVVRDLDRCAAPGPREPAARERQVERAGRLDEHVQRVGLRRDGRRELAEDALDLLARVRRSLGQAVVQLDDGERLDEERLPGARRVVHHSRHLRTSRRANGEHGPAAALGEERLLQRVLHVARARDARELVAHARAAVAQLGAQLAQQRRRRVADIRPVLLDPAVDLVGEPAEARVDGLEERGEHRLAQDALRLEGDPDRDRDRPQLVGTQQPAAARPFGGRAHVADPGELRRGVGGQHDDRRPTSARAGARPSPGRPTARARARASRRGRSRRRLQDDRRSPAARAQRAPQRP